MENASKALLMAGGMLIALVILALLVYVAGTMSDVLQVEEDVEETQKVEAYNKEYLSYDRKLIRGTEIISLVNKVKDNNEKYSELLDEYEIKVNVRLKFDLKVYTRNSKGEVEVQNRNLWSASAGSKELSNPNEYKKILGDTSSGEFKDFKRRLFNCTGITFNEKSGRVNELNFEESEKTNESDLMEGF